MEARLTIVSGPMSGPSYGIPNGKFIHRPRAGLSAGGR